MTALSGLLDELMGKNRNAAPNEKTNELHWSDEEVCKHFLCGFCPAELFTNTRSDLGACDKTHDEQTRKTYQQSSRYLKMGYEEEFLRFLQHCWQDVERRIRRNHQRLQLSEEKNQQQRLPAQSSETEEKIQVLNKRITEMLENIEKLGSEGEVEQAQAMMKLCDQLKEEREQLQTQKGGIMDTFAVQEKQMEVCEVCGAFLIVGDAQSRVDDHLMGKQHMGYAKIKTAIVELKDKLTKAAEENRDKRSDRRQPERDQSSRDRDRRDQRDQILRDRDRRSHEHSRSSRDRDRRSRDDRYRSSRDADRRRSRDRDRRSLHDRKRSRDRDRRRSRDRKSKDDRRRHDRSRSRDKKRSRRSDSKRRDKSLESKRSEEEKSLHKAGKDDRRAHNSSAEDGGVEGSDPKIETTIRSNNGIVPDEDVRDHDLDSESNNQVKSTKLDEESWRGLVGSNEGESGEN